MIIQQWVPSLVITDSPDDLYLMFYQSADWANVFNVQVENKVTAGSVTNFQTFLKIDTACI